MEKGANIEEKDSSGYTPLQYALRNSPNLDVIKVLLEKGANIEEKNRSGDTPLIYAVRKRDFDVNIIVNIVRLLLDFGADTTAKSEYGKTAVDYAKDYRIRDLLLGVGGEKKGGFSKRHKKLRRRRTVKLHQ